MKHDHLNTVVKLLAAFLLISLSTVVAVVLMRHNPALVTTAVWVRTPLVAASAAVLLLFARRAAAGHRSSFRRLRVISMVVLAAIIGVVDPRSTLQQTGPIPLTLAGSGHIDKDRGRDPASIDYTWEYHLTIQRVDAEGNPL